jgi:hypothetical protein
MGRDWPVKSRNRKLTHSGLCCIRGDSGEGLHSLELLRFSANLDPVLGKAPSRHHFGFHAPLRLGGSSAFTRKTLPLLSRLRR